MRKICISMYEKNARNAGPKAKTDIENILKNKFNFEIKTIVTIPSSFINKLNRVISSILVSIRCSKYDIVVIQTPTALKGFEYYIFKKIKNKVLVIHDIDGIRKQNTTLLQKEINYYKTARYVISHNFIMTNFLISHGIDENKIVTLELFDYLVKNSNETIDFNIKEPKVYYCGNLSNKKCPFVYSLDDKKIEFKLLLYGKGSTITNKQHIKYMGSFRPDDISTIEGNIGLIWDGNVDDSDENETYKNYTRYNNPHKLSCYLAVGTPVIVWRKAAAANFVSNNDIGYLIDNLYDINNLDFSDYDKKKKNAEKISKKVRTGFYFSTAITKIISNMQRGE